MTIGSFTRRLAIIIMAAGKGTRMKSDLPKVLHPLNHHPMVSYVLDIARTLIPSRLIVVVGFGKDQVMEAIHADDVTFAFQDNPQGTGHAVMQTESALKDFSGDVLILSGDVPLLPAEILDDFIQFHHQSRAWLTLMTAELPDPTGYGRIVRNDKGLVTAIVEEKDADDRIRNIKEFNSGIYLVQSSQLFFYLHKVDNNNVKKEYYLTDLVRIAIEHQQPVAAYQIEDANLVLGINTIQELHDAEQVLIYREGSPNC
jgi:UDP-N-acetylglucosamine diphosphorylase/glucosamine-1-phosphate N-acetyltransferase